MDDKHKIINWSWKKCFRPESLFIRRLLDAGFSHKQIAQILAIEEITCTSCFDNNKDCECIYNE